MKRNGTFSALFLLDRVVVLLLRVYLYAQFGFGNTPWFRVRCKRGLQCKSLNRLKDQTATEWTSILQNATPATETIATSTGPTAECCCLNSMSLMQIISVNHRISHCRISLHSHWFFQRDSQQREDGVRSPWFKALAREAPQFHVPKNESCGHARCCSESNTKISKYGFFFWPAPFAFRRVTTWSLLADQRGIEPPPAVCPRRQERRPTNWATRTPKDEQIWKHSCTLINFEGCKGASFSAQKTEPMQLYHSHSLQVASLHSGFSICFS